MFQIDQQVTVTNTPTATGYNRDNGLPLDAPVLATITALHGDGANGFAEVTYPDGHHGSPNYADCQPVVTTPPAPEGAIVAIELAREDNSAIVLETPANAPLAAVDPLDTWEAGLADSEAVRAAIWDAADQAARLEGACSEYEATVAYPHGHSGREGYDPDNDSDGMGSGEVTYRRTVTRTYIITQEATVDVEAGEDAWETMRENAEWEDIDTDTDYDDQEDDYGPETYNDDREPMESGPNEQQTMPAALVRAALDTVTPYRLIRDAILTTAQEHGAPVSKTSTVGIAAYISRPDAGAWTAPAQERLDDQPISQWQADTLSNPRTFDAYDTARRMFEADGQRARLVHGTLAAVLKSEWCVTA